MGFPISAPQNWGFWPLKSPKMVQYQQSPQKALPCMGTHVFWCAVRPERVEKKVGTKNFKAPSNVYFTLSPRDFRRVANSKLCSLRQTPEIINPTNFQLDPHQFWLHGGVEVGVSQRLSKLLLQLAARMCCS